MIVKKIFHKIPKILYSAFVFIISFISLLNPAMSATNQQQSPIKTQESAFQQAAQFNPDLSIGGVMALVIKGFLGLLGIIFVVLIITAGYNWMTAAGEEEKINKAKDTLKRAIIGLIIVVSAYAITYFVFTNLPGGGGGTQGPG